MDSDEDVSKFNPNYFCSDITPLLRHITEDEVLARCLFTLNRNWIASAELPGKVVRVLPGTALPIMPPAEFRVMHGDFLHDFSETISYALRQKNLEGQEEYALCTGRLTWAERCALLVKFHQDWKLPTWVPTSSNVENPQLRLIYEGQLINGDPTSYNFYNELRGSADQIIEHNKPLQRQGIVTRVGA